MTAASIKISLLALFLAFFVATSPASARPDSHKVREAVREAQQYQKDGRTPDRNHRFHDAHPSDTSSGADASKRAGRMSPEEKRALRQQINEASQDLYSRRQ